jgi:hypothetical protein
VKHAAQRGIFFTTAAFALRLRDTEESRERHVGCLKYKTVLKDFSVKCSLISGRTLFCLKVSIFGPICSSGQFFW